MARPKSPVRLDWIDPAACSRDYRLTIIGRLSFVKYGEYPLKASTSNRTR
ncbi:MAG: hypothetical protein WBW94_15350 [Anaerolineales bacterium]